MGVVTLAAVVALSILVALGGTRVLIGLLFALMMRGALQRTSNVAAPQRATASTTHF